MTSMFNVMGSFRKHYILLRAVSTVVGVSIVVANFWLWHWGPDDVLGGSREWFYLAVGLGFQSFLFSYLGFLIAHHVAKFYWARWRSVPVKEMESFRLHIALPSGRVIRGMIHLPGEPVDDNEPAVNTNVYQDADVNGEDIITGKRAIQDLGLVIICHGLNDTQDRSFPFARALAAHGYSVFTWEYRGTGRTPGRITRFHEHVLDLRELVEFWSRTREEPVHLLGWSLGGMIVLNGGLDNPGVGKIFAWSTWSDLRRVLRRIYLNPVAFLRYLVKGQLLWVSKEMNKLVSPRYFIEQFKRKFASHDDFKAYTRSKVFLCHARDDDAIPFREFEKNRELLSLGPANFHVFDKGAHLMLRNETILLGLALRFLGGW